MSQHVDGVVGVVKDNGASDDLLAEFTMRERLGLKSSFETGVRFLLDITRSVLL